MMIELISEKSEEHIFLDENKILNENHLASEKQTVQTTVEKNISHTNLDENITSKVTAIFREDNIGEKFFTIYPKIDIDRLMQKYTQIKKIDNKKVSIQEKKQIFIEAVLPAIRQSRKKLIATYKSIETFKDAINLTIQDEEYLELLYKTYRIRDGEIDELLLAVKPHPISVVLAQATLESGWGTSRFYKEANNIFGIWSFNKADDRIKAKTGKDIYLKKYDSFVEAIDDYMAMLGRNPRYKEFRKTRLKTENPYEIIKYLEMYSELRAEYVNRLKQVIRVNKFQKYDIK